MSFPSGSQPPGMLPSLPPLRRWPTIFGARERQNSFQTTLFIISAHLLQTWADVHSRNGFQFAALNTNSSIFSSSSPGPGLMTSNTSGSLCCCCLDSMINDLFANIKEFSSWNNKELGFVATDSTQKENAQVLESRNRTATSTIRLVLLLLSVEKLENFWLEF
jgi:hypothetical protein